MKRRFTLLVAAAVVAVGFVAGAVQPALSSTSTYQKHPTTFLGRSWG